MKHLLILISIVCVIAIVLPAAAQEPNTWEVRRNINPLDDSETVAASLTSETGTGGFDNFPIAMIIRCQSNELEIFFNWLEYLGSGNQQVIFRFPPNDAITARWRISTDNTSTFVNSPSAFARSILISPRLVVQTTPFGESPVTAVFDLTEAEDHVDDVLETCFPG